MSWVPADARVPEPEIVAPPSETPRDAGAAASTESQAQDAAARRAQLARDKVGPLAQPMASEAVMETLPDASAAHLKQRQQMFEEHAKTKQDAFQDSTLAYLDKMAPVVTQPAPTGAAIIQVLSLDTIVPSADGPMFRIVRVFADTAAERRRRGGKSAMEYALSLAERLLQRQDVCALPYFIIETGVPFALPLTDSAAGYSEAWALQKGQRNLDRLNASRQSIVDSAREAYTAQGSMGGERQLREHLHKLQHQLHTRMDQHNAAMLKRYRTLQSKYQAFKQEAMRSASAGTAATQPPPPPSQTASSWTLDDTGVPGGSTFPDALKDAMQTMVHIVVGPDLDTKEDASRPDAPKNMEKIAVGMEPWVCIYPWSYANEAQSRRNGPRVAKATTARFFPCVDMYEWISPAVFNATRTAQVVTADSAGDQAKQMLDDSMAHARENQTRVEQTKDALEAEGHDPNHMVVYLDEEGVASQDDQRPFPTMCADAFLAAVLVH